MNLCLQNKVVVVADYGGGLAAVLMRLLEEEGAVARLIVPAVAAADSAFKVQYVGKEFGYIDGLVHVLPTNNRVGLEAGDYSGFIKSLDEQVAQAWLITKAALPWLETNGGVIINCISQTAETGQGGSSGYAASNGCRIGLTTGWAVELQGKNIRVNGVVVAEGPGPLHRRASTWQEIAATVIFLLSPAATGMRGELVYVDGGYVHLAREIDEH